MEWSTSCSETCVLLRGGRRRVLYWYSQMLNKSRAFKRPYFVRTEEKDNCLIMSCYWGQRELSLAGLQGNSNLLAPHFFSFYFLRRRHNVGWCSMSRTRSKFRLHAIKLFAPLTDKRVKCAPICRAYIFQMPSLWFCAVYSIPLLGEGYVVYPWN
jgi:hypothetical protein